MLVLLSALSGCWVKEDSDNVMRHLSYTISWQGKPFDDVLASLRRQGEATITNEERFGMPPPPESKDADNLLRRVTVDCVSQDGMQEQFVFDIDGRENVMQYSWSGR